MQGNEMDKSGLLRQALAFTIVAVLSASIAPILLKKSFREAARNFSKPLVRG